MTTNTQPLPASNLDEDEVRYVVWDGDARDFEGAWRFTPGPRPAAQVYDPAEHTPLAD